jgi:hypothetical protein
MISTYASLLGWISALMSLPIFHPNGIASSRRFTGIDCLSTYNTINTSRFLGIKRLFSLIVIILIFILPFGGTLSIGKKKKWKA